MKSIFAFALGVAVSFIVQCAGRGPIVEIPTAVTSSSVAEKREFDFEIEVVHERTNDTTRSETNNASAVGPELRASGDVDLSDLRLDTPRVEGLFGEGGGGGSFTIAGLTVSTPPAPILVFYIAAIVCGVAALLIAGLSKGRLWKLAASVGGLGGLFVMTGVLVNTYPVVILVVALALLAAGLVWGYKAVVADRKDRALGSIVHGLEDAEEDDEEIASHVKSFIRDWMKEEKDFAALDAVVDAKKG